MLNWVVIAGTLIREGRVERSPRPAPARPGPQGHGTIARLVGLGLAAVRGPRSAGAGGPVRVTCVSRMSRPYA
jgi:hypothetical protein